MEAAKLRLFLALILTLLGSCAGNGDKVEGSSSTFATLPFPSERGASSLTEYVLTGSSAEEQSGGAAVDGEAMVLVAALGGFEYALYRFNPAGAGAGSPDSVSVLFQEAATSEAWIGLANYAQGAWEFNGPYKKPKTLVIDEPQYVSSAGDIWIAVLTAAEQSARVEALSVRTVKLFNEPPVADFSRTPVLGDAPLHVVYDGTLSTDPDGLIMQYDWDFDGDGIWDAYDSGPNVEHTFLTGAPYRTYLRVTDDAGERITTSRSMNVNNPPVASFSASPQESNPGELIELDASASSDSDGPIVSYEWDLDDDGIFEIDGGGSSSASFYLPIEPNYYKVTLKVTDENGASATAVQTLTMMGWYISPSPDSAGDVGTWTSLAMISGHPAISYLDETNQSLKFVRASDPYGRTWGEPVTLNATPSNSDKHISLKEVNGRPAIAFRDGSNLDLMYVRANDAAGTTWPAPMILDSQFNVGGYPSLAVINGNPAIAYYEYANDDLKYIRATDANGDTWGASLVVDGTDIVGRWPSLAVVYGNPAISYRNQTGNDLMYVRAADANGDTWSSPVIAHADNDGRNTTLAVFAGLPRIVWHSVDTYLWIRHTTAHDYLGENWGLWGGTGHVDGLGQYLSLAVIGNVAGISDYHGGNGDLLFREWNPPSSSPSLLGTLDTSGDVGQHNSIADVNGNFGISYYDATNGELKFIRRY